MSDFPTDDVTLSMLEVACRPEEEDGVSHLMEFLAFGSTELEPYVHVDPDTGDRYEFPVFAGGYSPADAILALIARVRGERVHREALNDVLNETERRLLTQRWWLSLALTASLCVVALALVEAVA